MQMSEAATEPRTISSREGGYGREPDTSAGTRSSNRVPVRMGQGARGVTADEPRRVSEYAFQHNWVPDTRVPSLTELFVSAGMASLPPQATPWRAPRWADGGGSAPSLEAMIQEAIDIVDEDVKEGNEFPTYAGTAPRFGRVENTQF